MSNKKLSIEEYIQKMEDDRIQRKLNEEIKNEEIKSRYDAQIRYINDSRNLYSSMGGRINTTTNQILTTFLGAYTNNNFYDPNGSFLTTLQSVQSDFTLGTYSTNILNIGKLYDLDITTPSFTQTVDVYENSVFAFNTNDNTNYFIGYDGTDTIFGKMDSNGVKTKISDIYVGSNTPITQLIYVGGLTSSTDFIYHYANQIYEINTNGVISGPNLNFKDPDLSVINPFGYMSSMVIVNGSFYAFIFDNGGVITFLSTYDPSTGDLNGGAPGLSMNSIPSEIASNTKVVEVVASTSDYGFPNTTGNKLYANILIGLDEIYYFIVEIDPTNGNCTYISNGDYVYDLSYYKKIV
jgi:hypothetical protein